MTETNIYQDKQNRESEEWLRLLEYIDIVERDEIKEFNPRLYLGDNLWKKITVLPKEIGKLKNITNLHLYGSSLERIPLEIGKMGKLRIFTPYTSPRLRWFPYEIRECKELRNSTVSTRRLYGNFKLRTNFPDLKKIKVTHFNSKISCGICKKIEESTENYEQYWTSLRVASDVLPLLISVCSESCYEQIPRGPKGYLETPHKGGINLEQPQKGWIPRIKSRNI